MDPAYAKAILHGETPELPKVITHKSNSKNKRLMNTSGKIAAAGIVIEPPAGEILIPKTSGDLLANPAVAIKNEKFDELPLRRERFLRIIEELKNIGDTSLSRSQAPAGLYH